MKKLSLLTLVALMQTFVMPYVLKAQNEAPKILVAYFSFPETDGVDANTGASRMIVNGKLYGTTEYFATIISEYTQADLHEIKTTHTYPSTHKLLIDYAKQEAETRTYPKLVSKLEGVPKYDVVFIGYPNWWYDMPMPIYTFLQSYDFSGKTIIPFCTHGGSGFSQSVENITQLEKEATIVRGPAISRSNLSNAKENLLKWLQKQGY